MRRYLFDNDIIRLHSEIWLRENLKNDERNHSSIPPYIYKTKKKEKRKSPRAQLDYLFFERNENLDLEKNQPSLDRCSQRQQRIKKYVSELYPI